MIRVSAVALVWIVSFVMMLRERYKEAYGYVGLNVISEMILIFVISGGVHRRSAFIASGVFLAIITTLQWKYEDIQGRSFFWDDDDLYFRGKAHFVIVKVMSFAVLMMTQYEPKGWRFLGMLLFYWGWRYFSSEFIVVRGMGVAFLSANIGWYLYLIGIPHALNICIALFALIAAVHSLLSFYREQERNRNLRITFLICWISIFAVNIGEIFL